MLRLLENAVSFLILCSIAVLLLINVRATDRIHRQLSDMDARITGLSTDTRCAIAAISRGLDDLSAGMQDEIASARRRTGGDVSRLGSRLSGSLVEMAQRMEDIAATTDAEVQRRLEAMSESIQRASSESDSTGRTGGTAFYEVDTRMHALELEADALFNRGRYKEASGKFALLLERQPSNADLRLKRAVCMFHANPSDSFGYSTIERELRTALETRGEIPMALEVLALLATERREWSQASAYFRRLLAMAPNDGRYLKEAAESSLLGGDLDTAKACIEETLRLFPQDTEAAALARRLHDALSNGGSR